MVTGGSRGIGRAIAAAFIEAGARVIITARGEEALQEAAKELGPLAIARTCDNADPAQIEGMIADAWRLGPIDILVNNAGVSPYYRRAEHVSLEEWDDVIDVNLRGTYFCSTEAAKRMIEANRPGAIINVSSVAGIATLERLGVYSAAKAGIHQLTRVMALEWAEKGIRVNAIAPGWTETDFTGELFASRFGDGLRASLDTLNPNADRIVGALANDPAAVLFGPGRDTPGQQNPVMPGLDPGIHSVTFRPVEALME